MTAKSNILNSVLPPVASVSIRCRNASRSTHLVLGFSLSGLGHTLAPPMPCEHEFNGRDHPSSRSLRIDLRFTVGPRCPDYCLHGVLSAQHHLTPLDLAVAARIVYYYSDPPGSTSLFLFLDSSCLSFGTWPGCLSLYKHYFDMILARTLSTTCLVL
jgi:hypothetical protein